MANAMQELMDMKIWFLWRKELNGDRINKVPFASRGGVTGTNEKYRHTWVTYNEAVTAMKKQSAAGVGFLSQTRSYKCCLNASTHIQSVLSAEAVSIFMVNVT